MQKKTRKLSEQSKATSHAYYLAHKEEREAKRTKRRKANLAKYAKQQREYRATHREEARKRARDWYANNRERALAWHKQKREALRLEMIHAYGGKCVCCGETNPRFLTIDHVDGGGTKHRRDVGWSGNSVTKHLKRLGWPQVGYQLLCFNCNCGRAYNNGICPHLSPALPGQY